MTEEGGEGSLLLAVSAILRELTDFPMGAERLAECRPIIAGSLKAIRLMDEADVEGLEPATQFSVE